MRHQHLLIRRLGLLLRSRMTTAEPSHLAQTVPWEHMGACSKPRGDKGGCTSGCIEARALIALTEPFMAPAPKPQPSKPLRLVVLQRPRRRRDRAEQPGLWESVAG